jgi:hypothetical protein
MKNYKIRFEGTIHLEKNNIDEVLVELEKLIPTIIFEFIESLFIREGY